MKKTLALILALVMTFSLVACAKKEEAPAPAPEVGQEQAPAPADDYPTKVIRNIVCTSAGGSTDLYNRLMATYIEPYLGQGFVVENVTGGAQVIGTTELVNSEPDGYTLGGGWTASFGMRPYLLDVTYSVDDVQFVCGVLKQIEACIVRADSPYQTLDDLMEAVKNDPTMKYSAGNAGSFQYFWSRYVMGQKGVSATFIPHDGDADALTSLLNGTVEFTFAETTSATAGIKSGDYRVLAICMTERDPANPDVPTLPELGYKCELSHTMSLIMPAGVPQERVDKVYKAVEQMMKDPEFIAACEKGGFQPTFKTGAQIRQEVDDMAAIIKPMIDAGLFG